MKKKVLGLIALLLVFIPIVTNAKTYNVDDDMSINIEDDNWYVFTRDNIKNNKELDELGITYDYMNDLFTNYHIYLDATIFYGKNNFIELLVRKKEVDEVKNLTNYSNEEIMEFALELAKKTGSTDYKIYENDYKFVESKYLDKEVGYYILEYSTVVNGTNYTITVQKTSKFNASEEKNIKKAIDSIKFNIDESLKEKKDNSLSTNSIISKAVVGAITGGIIGFIYWIFNRKKNKKVSNI